MTDAERGLPAAVFGGDPDVGRDLAQVDWAATPLGAPSGWPQSLRTAVSILLSSRFPMWMAWGPELTFFCNAAYRRDTLGRKYPWALGRPANEVWSEIWDDIGPRIDRVLSTEQSTWDVGLLLFLERSGYPEETYHTFSYSPLRDDEGQVVGMLCVVSEDTHQIIGERRMATLRDLGSDPSVIRSEEESLAFAHRQLGNNLRDLPFTLTYLFDEDGDARLAGTSGITPGHPAAPLVLPADGSSLWPVQQAARGESVLIELDGAPYSELPTGDWPEAPVKAMVVPLIEQGGTASGFLVAALNRYRPTNLKNTGFVTLVARYIAAGIGSARSYRSQQRRAEELAELDRAKTRFFSNISHEFRTPLTLILDPVAELRGRSTGLDDEMRQDLDIVWRSGLRLTKLVNTLLDFSRIEAGRAQARYEPVDLSAVTSELASVFRSAVDRAGLEFNVDCAPLDEPVYVDRDMWEKVVLNLLSNALKFTFDGSVSVAVRREGDEAVVTIADTGIGVAAEEMPRLFERFHRIESARARSDEGSGIGLALVKELVALHGGTIGAESAPDTGTRFTVRLPFGSSHLPADAVTSTAGTRAPSGVAEPYLQEALRWTPGEATSRSAEIAESALTPDNAVLHTPGYEAAARVLVADDNTDMREYLVRLLNGAGYRVDAVTDGQLALETIRAGIPDLVISDVMMPRLDGLALVAALRSDPRTAAVPVVLLSARAGQEASIEGLQAGADDYLVKPFAAAELLARVRANIELARLRSHHSRWRTALVDSLQEAFFVCNDEGAVIEINAAFTEITGYGTDGLPYRPVFPWWPSADTDPEARRQVEGAFAELLNETDGTFTIPIIHRNGHRVWVTVNFNHAEDPETGRRVMVGTFRDVTAEHYTVQRESALASLNQQLAQADTLDDAVWAAAEELRSLYRARRVLAVTLPADNVEPVVPQYICVGAPTQWAELPPRTKQMITSLGDGELLTPETGQPGFAGISLRYPRGVLVLHIELVERRPFISEDDTLLTVLAGRLGQGLQRVHQLDQQRETALALQNAILGPSSLPDGFAVRYQPATSPLQVGGDWYDVVELDDGRIALIVGDCVGHGLAAATVMGQLRSACRALLLERLSPSAALTALDQFAARLPGARCTTAFCGVLSPDTGELVYSSAGHPPPIMVYADGTTRLLDGAGATPLGIFVDRPRPEHRETLPPRATVLLYTDGLVERRREPLDTGIARAADLVQENRDTGLDDLARQVMSRLAPGDGFQDDVALLLYRQPAPLEMEFPPEASHLAETRAALRDWLGRAGVDADQTLKVLIAAGEALANAIEHGHRHHTGGTISLRATALADRLHVTVIDAGSWKTPVAAAHRGRGLSLMRALMQEVTIEPLATGTKVHMLARIA
ncbi:MAG TPA: SpoIIE family protein phosphatase [Mycobacterium sp.]|nr:SpoIIE family protein phosphatase [Mycobacterium sp.]